MGGFASVPAEKGKTISFYINDTVTDKT